MNVSLGIKTGIGSNETHIPRNTLKRKKINRNINILK